MVWIAGRPWIDGGKPRPSAPRHESRGEFACTIRNLPLRPFSRHIGPVPRSFHRARVRPSFKATAC
jgi:hypothetical protein